MKNNINMVWKVSLSIVHSPIYNYDSMHWMKTTEFYSQNASAHINMQFYE